MNVIALRKLAKPFASLMLVTLFGSRPIRAADLDFYSALDHMIAKNQNLASEESLNQSELQSLDADRKSFLPTLRASLIHARDHAVGTEAYPKNTYWQAEMGLNLYRFGQDSARYRLADRGDTRYASARLRQILDTERIAAEKLLAYIFYSQDRAVLEKLRRVRERLLAVARNQYGKGLLPDQEVKKVDIDLRSLALQIKQADVDVEQARLELSRFLAEDQVRVEWPFEPGRAPLSVVGNNHEHPLFTEAKDILAMEKEREKILWAAQYPSLDAVAVANRSLSGDGFNRGQTEILLTLSVPLFDQGLSRSLYRSQTARSTAASQQLEWIRQNLEVQKATAAVALKENLSNTVVYEELISLARSLYQNSLTRFERGLITVNDLGVDEARLYGAERDRVQSAYQLHLSWVSACQSHGLRLDACRNLTRPGAAS